MVKCRLGWVLALIVALLPLGARAEKVLRVVPHAELKILDPYATTATITQMHGQMVYDQLFGWNEKLEPICGTPTIVSAPPEPSASSACWITFKLPTHSNV